MTRKPGTRVFAVLSATPEEVRIIGRGEYLGDLPFNTADEDVRLFGGSPKEIEDEAPGFCNPCLKMDDGTIVWGCECWWGPEDGYDKMVNGRKVVQVDIKEERKRFV